jgi:ABC-type branched-subunit amino acid transport system substrate-binding protein
MGNNSVTIFHPPSQRTQRASRDAFDRVWSEDGWQLADQPDAAASADDEREELIARAEALGVKVRANAKAETIAARIAEHLAEHGGDPDGSDGDGTDDDDLDDDEADDA